jgi:epoxyqueuosine reductase
MDDKLITGSGYVQEFLSRIDVDLIGIASIKDCKGTRLEKMALTLLPEANSIVVLAMEIYPEILGHARPEKTAGAPAPNDLLDRHLEFLNGRLTKSAHDVAKASHKNGLKALPLSSAGCPTDARFLSAVFSYKHAAESAGLGSIGRSSLLISPSFGPRIRLGCCLTEAVLEPSKLTLRNPCSGCNICITNCPANALSLPKDNEPYVINKFACSAFRNAAGGCSECMRLCPAGR